MTPRLSLTNDTGFVCGHLNSPANFKPCYEDCPVTIETCVASATCVFPSYRKVCILAVSVGQCLWPLNLNRFVDSLGLVLSGTFRQSRQLAYSWLLFVSETGQRSKHKARKSARHKLHRIFLRLQKRWKTCLKSWVVCNIVNRRETSIGLWWSSFGRHDRPRGVFLYLFDQWIVMTIWAPEKYVAWVVIQSLEYSFLGFLSSVSTLFFRSGDAVAFIFCNFTELYSTSQI